MKKVKFLVSMLVLSFILVVNSSVNCNAYVLNGKKLYTPTDAFYWVDYDFGSSRSYVISGLQAWDSLSEIEFTKEVDLPGGADIRIEYIDWYNGDTYAVSRGSGNISV